MTFLELLTWVTMQNGRLRAQFNDVKDDQQRTLGRTVKLGEEFGELCSEILGHYSLQRKEKLDGNTAEKLEGEFADVLITTLLLADHMGIDIGKSLENKIEKINARYE
jgi:NTP pyrophosphatase (non-canonical NTP hydrolase)